MADLVWRVIVQPNVPMYFWNQIKAKRYSTDRGIYTAPVQVDRPEGQPVN